jgi:hypothetical protein
MCDQYGSVGRAEAIVYIYYTDVQEAEVQYAEKGLSSVDMVFCGSLEIFHPGGPIRLRAARLVRTALVRCESRRQIVTVSD